MSRRLSKKSRATKLATTVAFSAANLPKLESSVLDALFARSPARKPSLRASLLVGSALTAGLLATSLVNVSPALAACSGAGTVTCTGAFPTPGGLPDFTGNTTVNLDTAIVGGNATNFDSGVVFNTTTFGQTLTTNVDAASTIGIGANYAVVGIGITMYSHFTGTTLSVSNAGAITSGDAAIDLFINDPGETANDKIAIINTAQINSGASGVIADIYAQVPDTFTATNTIAITNSGQIGTKTTYVGGFGILSKIVKTGYAPQPGGIPASITGINNQYNSKNIYSRNTSEYVGTFITDVAKGAGFATSGITNSGNLISQVGSGLEVVAYGGTAKGGSGSAAVTISNTGTLTAGNYGIRGNSHAYTGYGAISNNATLNGGHAIAATTISNAGNVTTGNATHSGNVGIYGHAYANAGANNATTGNKSTAIAGSATAGVTITNGNATVTPAITVNGNQSAVGGSADAFANGFSFIGNAGVATATTSVYNSGALSIKPISGNSTNATLYGVAIASAVTEGNITKGGSATGGTANATVTLSNIGSITSPGNAGIYGYAMGSATGGYLRPPFKKYGFGLYAAYNATGGTASATVTISNTGTLAVRGDGVYGKALEYANAFGNTSAAGGTGTGGVAPATVSITNSAAMTSKVAMACMAMPSPRRTASASSAKAARRLPQRRSAIRAISPASKPISLAPRWRCPIRLAVLPRAGLRGRYLDRDRYDQQYGDAFRR